MAAKLRLTPYDISSSDGIRPVADLEMTSYMVLSLIELSGADNMVTANKAIKWIVSQRDKTFFNSPQVRSLMHNGITSLVWWQHGQVNSHP